MKTVFGVLLMLGGIALGLWLGLWVCFVGGIVQIIEQIKAPEVQALTVAWAIVKIVFAGLVGVLSAIFPIAIGQAMLGK